MEEKKTEEIVEIEDTRPEYMKKRVLVPSITAIIFLISGIFYGIHTVYYKSTDDAFIEGHVITVAPRVSGPVLNLNIEDNQEVKKGDFLLEIDPNDYQAKLRETKAKLEEAKALAIADTDAELLDAFYRLAQLLDKPESEQQIMSNIIIKEIYYRLLTGPLAYQLRLINTKGTRSNQIAEAISILKEKFSEKLDMDELAQSVNMAPSSFYRNFKKVTQVSPLQYQKQLKLYEAQRLMLSGNYDAATASYEVGYESPTKFSREYKKMFGNPPKTDIKKLAMA